MSDLISVVIPAYNHENYVQDTIKSILNQTYQNIELIIINDGSPDQTHEKIEELLSACRARCVNVEYVNKPNEGAIKSQNLGMSLAKGKFIYLIASDDIAKENAIEVLHSFLGNHDEFGLAVGDNAIMDSKGRTCFWGPRKSIVYDEARASSLTHAGHLKRKRPDIDFDGEGFGSYPKLLQGNHIPNGYLLRKSVIDQFGGYNEDAPMDDWYLMLQIAKYAKMKYIDRVLFQYRWHDSNTIKQKDKMQRFHQQTLQGEMDYIKEHGYLQYVPRKYELKIMSLKLFQFKRTATKTTAKLLGIPVYSHK
ncbi:glycosyltransferase family 2 protein [Verrucomicrobiota bacterium]